jgi:hypothetical protein
MMLPETEPARKPRRLGLFIPFLLVALLAGAWCGGWFWLSGQLVTRMDAVAAEARAHGRELSWKTREVTGFPFRLDVTLTDAHAADGSGWAISAPTLTGEAFPYAINHWVFEAPQGVTITRPGINDPLGGDVTVTGEALRASLVVEDGAPFPRISVEGVKLAFATPQGAAPFWMRTVDHLEFHFRPGPDDQGALLLRLDGASPRLTGLVARIAQDKPVNLVLDSTFSHARALTGPNWPDAARAWTAAGGRLTLSPGSKITGGEAEFGILSGDLGIGPDGRLAGHLDTQLRQAPRALAAMAQDGKVDPATATAAAVAAAAEQDQNQTFKALILFEDGKTKLGPLPLMESPRVY